MERDEFADLVEQAVAALPPQIRREITNVSFEVDDGRDDPHLLGLYHGVPRTERDESYTFRLPDTITVYRLPVLRRCATREDVVRQVEVTVKHEVGHYFGIEEDRLHDLGWG